MNYGKRTDENDSAPLFDGYWDMMSKAELAMQSDRAKGYEKHKLIRASRVATEEPDARNLPLERRDFLYTRSWLEPGRGRASSSSVAFTKEDGMLFPCVEAAIKPRDTSPEEGLLATSLAGVQAEPDDQPASQTLFCEEEQALLAAYSETLVREDASRTSCRPPGVSVIDGFTVAFASESALFYLRRSGPMVHVLESMAVVVESASVHRTDFSDNEDPAWPEPDILKPGDRVKRQDKRITIDSMLMRPGSQRSLGGIRL